MMKRTKFFAGALSLVMLLSALPVAIAETQEDYIFYEDFEGVTYNAGFDSPLATGDAGQRWSSEVAGDSTNHYMKYTIDTDVPNVQGRNSKPYDLSVQGTWNEPLYPLDRNAWYEAGYRFDMNDCTPYLNSFGSFMISDAYGGVANVCAWYPRNTTVSMNNGYNENGVKEDITVTLAQVDGFITTKIVFNLHGDTETAQNYRTNGEAIVEVTYKKTDGSNVYEKRRFEFQTNRNGAAAYRYDRFRGLSANEISCTSAKGSSFFLDDIYIKEFKTYSVTFDKNDGSGETIEKQSDLTSTVELPEVSRESYQFDGWYKDSALTESFDGNNVQENMTVYAKWLKLNKVTFEKNGGSGVDFVETTTASIELPTPPTKERNEFDGWFTDSELTIPFDGTGIAGDMTVYAKWKYAWEISFDTNGGEPLEPRYAVSNLSDIPTAEWLGYRFDGWYTDEELTDAFDGSVTADITVYAKWTKKYIVTFESNGGSVIAPIYTLEDLAELPVPEKQGYRNFEGWFLDQELTERFDGTGITGDLTVYAAYNNNIFYENFEGATYNTGFDSPLATGDAGQRWSSEVAGDSTNHYMKYTIDTDVPNVQGQNSKPYDLLVPGTGSEPLYPLDRNAWYEAGYRFDMNDCTPRLNNFCTFLLGDAYTGGGVICAWFVSNTTLSMNNGYNDSGEKENITVTLAEVDGFITTKIFFNMHGDTETAENFRTNGEAIVEVTYKKTDGSNVYEKRRFEFQTSRNGAAAYCFDRFKGLSANEISCTSAKGSSFYMDDIYIKEISSNAVTFESNGGAEVPPITTVIGSIILPETTKDGVAFAGWYTDEECTQPFDGKNITSDITVYAKWIPIRTVAFNTNGGNVIENMTVADGGSIELPTPEKALVGFVGWYLDEECTLPFDGQNITSDITVYAKWAPMRTVTFDTNDGEALENMAIIDGGSIDLPTPVKEPFTFAGWYLDEAFTAPFDGQNITSDVTVYAKWTSYLYRQDFEGEGATGFEVKSTAGYWHSEITGDAGGNKYIRYWRTLDEVSWDVAYQSVFGGNVVKANLNPNEVYEVGYRFMPNQCDIYFNSFMGLKVKEKYGRDVPILEGALRDNLMNLCGVVINSTNNIIGFIDVKQIVDFEKRTKTPVITYTYNNGETNTVIGEPIALSNYMDYSDNWTGELEWTINNWDETGDKINNEIIFDDFYVKAAENYYISFNSNGGSPVEDVVTDYTGEVILPADPTRDEYTFAGWFTDTALTVPFTAETIGRNITLYARWQQTPTVESITPVDNEQKVGLRPEIKITFDSEMLKSTINTNTIKVMNGSQELDGYTVDYSLNNERKTVATVSITGKLSLEKTYTIIVSADASNLAGGMAGEFSSSFTTASMILSIDNVTITENNIPVTNIMDAAGKTVSISFNVNNNTPDTQIYVPVINLMSGTLLKSAAIGNASNVNGSEADSATVEIAVPTDIESGDNVGIMTVESLDTLRPLSKKKIATQAE